MRTNIKQYRKSQKRDENQPIMLSSADLASHDDVLIEILLRLPIRSLLRSKCVSKHWQSLISDHRFGIRRNPNPKSPQGLFLQRIRSTCTTNTTNSRSLECDFVPFDIVNYVKPPFKTLKFDVNENENENVGNLDIIVLHSCNGVMLCYSMNEYLCNVTKLMVYNPVYYVYNPTINQVVTLPKLEGCDWVQRRPRGMTLVFDPLKSSYYKVVCVRGYMWTELLYNIDIYSSESKSWKMCGKPFGIEIDTEFMCGVYWNDAVHWIDKKGFVLYLKINEECLDRIPIPVTRAGWNVKRHCYPLVESRDCLLFIDVPSLSIEFDVYEMNRDYSGWLVKYHVDLNQVMKKYPETSLMSYFGPGQSFVIHCLVLGEKEENSFLVLEVCGKAIRYNIALKTCEELCDLDVSHSFRMSVADDGFSKVGRWPGAFLFFESLIYV